MGYYVGPTPEPTAFDNLRYALDDLQGAIGEKIAPAFIPIVDSLAWIIAQHEPRRMGAIPPTLPPPPKRPQAPATGPTERLSGFCPKCGDAYPHGARFCIECGAPL